MEIIKPGTNIDFLKKRRTLITVAIAMILGVFALLPLRMHMGVDFAGGTEIEVKFNRDVEAKEVRQKVEEAGFAGASVQQIGDAAENGFLIRVAQVSVLTKEQEERLKSLVDEKLGGFGVVSLHLDEQTGDLVDLRTERPVPLADLRQVAEQAGIPLSTNQEAIRDLTRGGQPAYQFVTQSLSDKVSASLQASFGQENVEVRRVEFVGPQVGKQLRNRGIMAVLLSMGAILLYVAFRFDVRFAPGVVLGLFHDVAVVLGYWVVTGREFNLTSIAVVLTVVGYTVNNTVVIFDRVREVMGRRKGLGLYETINTAINESLSRTVMTSSVTALSLIGLLLFTRGSLFDFAAAMLVGIIAGTYSSLYVTGPVALWVDERLKRREAEKKAEGGGKAAHA